MMKCKKCKSSISEESQRCGSCGNFVGGIESGSSEYANYALIFGMLSPLIIFAPFALVYGALTFEDVMRHPEKKGLWRGIISFLYGLIWVMVIVVNIIQLANPL